MDVLKLSIDQDLNWEQTVGISSDTVICSTKTLLKNAMRESYRKISILITVNFSSIRNLIIDDIFAEQSKIKTT